MRPQLIALGYQPFAQDETALASWEPDDPGNFGMWFSAGIGSEDGDGYDTFDGFVCTPRWLEEHDWDEIDDRRPQPGTIWGRPLVIQRRWSYDELRATIESLCASAEAPTWRPLASWVDRYLGWEYDYRYEEERGIRDLAAEEERRRRASEWGDDVADPNAGQRLLDMAEQPDDSPEPATGPPD